MDLNSSLTDFLFLIYLKTILLLWVESSLVFVTKGSINLLRALAFVTVVFIRLCSISEQAKFASRAPLRIRVGAAVQAERGYDELAYVLMDEGDTVFVARSGMLEDFSSKPESFRNRRVVKMLPDDVVSIDAILVQTDTDDLSGEGHVRYAAEQWTWRR